MFLLDLTQALIAHKVKFAIAGGYAVVLHGVTRGTVGIDIVITINEKNFAQAEAALQELGLSPRLPVTSKDVFHFRKEYIEKRNLIAWSFTNLKNPTQVVDIIITHDLANLKTKTMKLHGVAVPVLSKDSLINMKKAKQFNKSENRLKPEDALQFLEDFQNTVHGRDSKTKLISLRVPENVLNAFKVAAKQQNKKYQSVIVQLMREWISGNK